MSVKQIDKLAVDAEICVIVGGSSELESKVKGTCKKVNHHHTLSRHGGGYEPKLRGSPPTYDRDVVRIPERRCINTIPPDNKSIPP